MINWSGRWFWRKSSLSLNLIASSAFCTPTAIQLFCLIGKQLISPVSSVHQPFRRLSPLTTPPVEKAPIMNLSLQEILIIGNCSDQVKFSELTMDMFRMLQTLEREPQEDFNHIYDASPAPGRPPFATLSVSVNSSTNQPAFLIDGNFQCAV
jgi:Protein SCAI